MSILDGLHGQITARALWTRISNPHLSPQEARSIAASELGQEHRQARTHQQTRLDAASHPLPPLRGDKPGQHHDPIGRNPLRHLLAKVDAVIRRIHRDEKLTRVRIAEPATPTPQPPEPPPPTILDKLVDAILPEPEPEPATPVPPTIRSPNSIGTAQLIVDNPHNSGGDHVTDAWRKSIQDNIVNFDQRRGTPSSGRYIG
jgi:hypothetical protein